MSGNTTNSTNVRQLMNVLSEKYFGNGHLPNANDQSKSAFKMRSSNQSSFADIEKLFSSSRFSPKFDTSPPAHLKQKENFNYFQQTKKKLRQAKSKSKKPESLISKTSKANKFQWKDSFYAISKSETEQLSNSNNFKADADINLNTNEPRNTNSQFYINSVAFANVNDRQKSSLKITRQTPEKAKGAAKKFNLKQISSFPDKPSLFIGKTEFLSSTPFQLSANLKKQVQEKQRDSLQKLKQQLEFYKQKCLFLDQQNLELKQKILVYEQQFEEQKVLVQNLKVMISKRESQINLMIQNQLGELLQKEKIVQSFESQNEALRQELEEVRNVMRQQEQIILELHSKVKQKNINQTEQKQKIQIKQKRFTGNDMKKGLDSSLNSKILSRSPRVSYLNRLSIQETRCEEEY